MNTTNTQRIIRPASDSSSAALAAQQRGGNRHRQYVDADYIYIDEHGTARRSEIPANLIPVAYRAFEILMEILTTHGNSPSPSQQEVLLYLLYLYFKMVTGEMDSTAARVVAALPTGYGKTSSIIAIIRALHEFEIEDISIAVAASKVEALSELKRELVRQAGPSILSKIGFMHSYRFDEAVAQRYKNGEAPLPDGFASEPAVWTDPHRKQFMLVTHARVRNGDAKSTELFNTYQGKERSLVIYDESLIPADVTSFPIRKLRQEIAYMAEGLDARRGLEVRKSQRAAGPLTGLLEWLQAVRDRIAVIDEDTVDMEGTLVTLPKLSEQDMVQYRMGLQERDWSQAAHTVLSLAGSTVRLHPAQDGLVATYETVIADDLKRVVVLDASYIVRELVREDIRTKAIEDLPGKFQELKTHFEKGLKTYPEMTVRTMTAPWGRFSMEKEFGGASADAVPSQRALIKRASGRKFVGDLVRTIKQIPEAEGILVFVYKDKGRISQRKVLEDALAEAGVDTLALVVDGQGQQKPRINIATWGSETSSNNWAYCRHVILAGVMQLPADHLLGAHLAAVDNLEALYDKALRDKIASTESLHLVYQAASRGACRATNSKAQGDRMTLWLVAPKNREFDKGMRIVFRGARFEKWIGDYGKQTEGKIERVGKIVAEFLEQFDEDSLSSIALKRMVPELGALPPKTAQLSINHALDILPDWIREGKSLVRTTATRYGFAV